MKMFLRTVWLLMIVALIGCGSKPIDAVKSNGLYDSFVNKSVMVKITGSNPVMYGRIIEVSASEILIQHHEEQSFKGQKIDRVLVPIGKIDFMMLLQESAANESEQTEDLIKAFDKAMSETIEK